MQLNSKCDYDGIIINIIFENDEDLTQGIQSTLWDGWLLVGACSAAHGSLGTKSNIYQIYQIYIKYSPLGFDKELYLTIGQSSCPVTYTV